MDSRLNAVASETVKDTLIDKAKDEVKSVNIETVALGLAVGGVVAGGVYIAQKIHDHASARQKEELEAYKKILKTRLDISEPNDPTKKIPFRTVFEKIDSNDEKKKKNDDGSLGSRHYSQEEMASWITHRPPSDADFSECNKFIDLAMTHVLTCYQKRFDRDLAKSNEGDITSAALRDLMLKLDDVKKSDGYSRKIAMLQGLDLAISDFYEGHEFRQKWLSPACPFLVAAVHDLEEQQDHLSLNDLIEESWPDASVGVRSLLEAITMLVTPEKDWDHIKDKVGKSNFDEALIAQEGMIHRGVSGWSLGVSSSAKYLVPSPFSDNLRVVAKLFSELKPNARSSQKVKKSNDNSSLKHLYFSNSLDKKVILDFFKNTDNFLTSMAITPDPRFANGKTASIYELYIEEEKRVEALRRAHQLKQGEDVNKYAVIIQDRVDFLYHLTKLAAEATTNIGLQLGISQCAKDRGELFISNPKHAAFLFGTVNDLSHQLCARDGYLIIKLKEIQRSHADCALSSKQKDLWNLIGAQLKQVKELTTSSVKKLNHHRSKLSFLHVREEVHRNDHWAVDIAYAAILRHKLPASVYSVEMPAHLAIQGEAKHDTTPESVTESVEEKYPQHDAQLQPFIAKKDAHDSDDEMIAEQKKLDIFEENPFDSSSRPQSTVPDSDREQLAVVKPIYNITNLCEILTILKNKITAIESGDEKTEIAKIQSYKNIHIKFLAIYAKAEKLINEKTAARYAKAVDLIQFTYHLCEETIAFLGKAKEVRAKEAHAFVDGILKEISKGNSDNKFIDDSKNFYGRLFGTKTRSKFNALEKEYIKMMCHP